LQQTLVGGIFSLVFGGTSGALCHTLCSPEQLTFGVAGKDWTYNMSDIDDSQVFYDELLKRITEIEDVKGAKLRQT